MISPVSSRAFSTSSRSRSLGLMSSTPSNPASLSLVKCSRTGPFETPPSMNAFRQRILPAAAAVDGRGERGGRSDGGRGLEERPTVDRLHGSSLRGSSVRRPADHPSAGEGPILTGSPRPRETVPATPFRTRSHRGIIWNLNKFITAGSPDDHGRSHNGPRIAGLGSAGNRQSNEPGNARERDRAAARRAPMDPELFLDRSPKSPNSRRVAGPGDLRRWMRRPGLGADGGRPAGDRPRPAPPAPRHREDPRPGRRRRPPSSLPPAPNRLPPTVTPRSFRRDPQGRVPRPDTPRTSRARPARPAPMRGRSALRTRNRLPFFLSRRPS